MQKNIMVAKASDLYDEDTPEGFLGKDLAKQFMNTILNKYEFKQRGQMEEDTSRQQPIPYVLLYNPLLEKYVGYKRSSETEKYGEKRLYGKWSLGVGGHVEEEEEGIDNPIEETAYREIEEEIGLAKEVITDLELIGAIRDTSTPVNCHHLGFVYIAKTSVDVVEVADGELEKVFFLSPIEIDEIIEKNDAEMESWSEIVWNEIFGE